jgi:hypothetical protein
MRVQQALASERGKNEDLYVDTEIEAESYKPVDNP